MGDGAFAHVAELFEDGELFLDSDAKRLVEFTAGLKDVRDLSSGDCARAHVAELFEDGELLLDSGAKRLVEFTAGLKDVCDSTLRDGDPPAVAGVGERISRVPVSGFRLLDLSERALQVAQLDRQIRIDRAPRGTLRKILLQFLDTRQTVRRLRGRTVDAGMAQVAVIHVGRQREIEHSRSPCPEIRRARRDTVKIS